MIRLPFFSIVRLAGVLLLLSGCAQNEPKPPEPPAPIIQPVVRSSEFDDLLAFGAEMAEMTPAKRAELCKSLVKASDPRIPLKLMIGRLLSSHCGSIPKIISRVKALELNDERLQQLVAIDSEALLNLLSQRKKPTTASERKSKSAVAVEPATKESPSAKDEAQLLREKLEAIRSIEKQMDESSEGN